MTDASNLTVYTLCLLLILLALTSEINESMLD